MNALRERKGTVIVLALVLLAAGGLWCWWANRPDPQVAKVRELGEKLRDAGQDLSPEERRDLGRQLREEAQKLSPEQRREAFAGGRRFEERFKQYLSLPKDERAAFLDKEIDRMEAWRERMEQERRNNPGPANNGRGGPGAWQSMSDEDRDRRRKERLDSGNAETRAIMGQYFKDLNARRMARGLPPAGGWGRGR